MNAAGGIVGTIAVVLVLGAVSLFAFQGNRANKQVLAETLAEPLDGAKTALVNVDPGDGNLTIDRLTGNEPLLAGGTLEYLEKLGQPVRTLTAFDGQATLTLEGKAGQSWFRLPWAACNGATTWNLHLNPSLPTEITAHTDGGNVKLDLAGLTVTRVAADTGGGNMEVVLPDNAEALNVSAKTGGGNVIVDLGSAPRGSGHVEAGSGAGNVEVHIPAGIAVRIHASSGMGKVLVDPQYAKIDGSTYQSAGYESATEKVELTLSSGAGNVIVKGI